MFTKHFFKVLMSFIVMILVGVLVLFVVGFYDDIKVKKEKKLKQNFSPARVENSDYNN